MWWEHGALCPSNRGSLFIKCVPVNGRSELSGMAITFHLSGSVLKHLQHFIRTQATSQREETLPHVARRQS